MAFLPRLMALYRTKDAETVNLQYYDWNSINEKLFSNNYLY